MTTRSPLTGILTVFALMAAPALATAIPILPDTFEDGTTMGWVNALGPAGGAAPLPQNIPTGGPAGTDDAYLLVTAIGGTGPGSRLTAMNVAQWTGDYLTAGVSAIAADVNNLGNSDLYLRLAFEVLGAMGPTAIAFSTNAVVVPAGSGWMSVLFPILPAALSAAPGLGTVEEALANTMVLRIYHSQAANFPNPFVPIETVNGQLGIDNITASGAPGVPEPATALLLVSGLAGALAARRRPHARAFRRTAAASRG